MAAEAVKGDGSLHPFSVGGGAKFLMILTSVFCKAPNFGSNNLYVFWPF